MDYLFSNDQTFNVILITLARIQGYQFAQTEVLLQELGLKEERINHIFEEISKNAAEYSDKVLSDLYAKFGKTPEV